MNEFLVTIEVTVLAKSADAAEEFIENLLDNRDEILTVDVTEVEPLTFFELEELA